MILGGAKLSDKLAPQLQQVRCSKKQFLGGFCRGGLTDQADYEPCDDPTNESTDGHQKRVSSGAKAPRLQALNVGAKAPTP
jgi:hypothetical protein